ncbi:MAG TPA: hypothetical protein VH328_10200, partial [Burkholderiaceae bacterium]|nr:hypothetical protein [Burkholderiaceae bacterium]
MKLHSRSALALSALAAVAVAGTLVTWMARATSSGPPSGPVPEAPAAPISAAAIATLPGMPPVVHPDDLYSETEGPAHLSEAVKGDLVRVYVPDLRGNSVTVIDPAAM